MRRVATLAGSALILSGCASTYMASVSPQQPIHAPSDRATIVFVHPRDPNVIDRQIVTLVDGDGRFMGQLAQGEHFALTMPPGPHRFVAFFHDHVDMLRADLLAGHVYTALVTMVTGDPWYMTPNLEAVRRDRPDWMDRDRLLADTRQLVSLWHEGQAALDPGAARRTIENAERRWASYSAAERAARELTSEDGLRDPLLPPAPPRAPARRPSDRLGAP